MKAWPLLGLLFIQAFLCFAHWFLYRTVLDFWWPLDPAMESGLRLALWILSFSFVAAALLGFRFCSWIVSLLYRLASIWLGFANFFFFGACLCWIVDFVLRSALSNAARLHARPYVAATILAAAFLVACYGFLNARWIRLRRVPVRLPNLPPSWRGRNALLMTDLHLGNINGTRFARHIAERARQLAPDIIFFSGDLFDGSHCDPAHLAAPLFQLAPPLGVYFVSGNHEEFRGTRPYSEAVARAGFKVLESEHVEVDRVHVIGVSYHDSNRPVAMRAFLMGLNLNGSAPSILLQHVPNRLPIADEAGVSLQLCGHTHGGQFLPFNWITHRAFGKFTYGLQRFGNLQVYTSSGAGTWGPPMRVGSRPEIVLLTFE